MSDSKETNTPPTTSAKPQTAKKKVSKNVVRKTQSKVAKNDVPKAVVQATSTPVEPSKTASSQMAPEKAKSSGKGLSVFALLLSLAALGGAGFTWYQTQVEQVQSSSSLAVGVTEIGGQVSRLSDTINLVKSRQDDIVSKQDLSNEIRVASQQYDAKLAPVISQQQIFEESISKISSDLQQGENQYVLNEVTQLLKLANHNVHFSKNVESAIFALKLADGQLKDLSDPRYATVRSKINEELAALQSVELVDVETLSAQLNQLSKMVPDLRLANEPEVKVQNVASLNAEAEQTTWRTELRKIWNDVLSSVQVQRVDQPPKPLLVPEQRYFLNQNLQLNLSKADLALLQGSQVIYQQSLSGAASWLADYFDTKNPQVKLVIKQLSDLQSKQVTIELPEITGSFDLLQSIKSK